MAAACATNAKAVIATKNGSQLIVFQLPPVSLVPTIPRRESKCVGNSPL
jgi:hypothetical protein